MPRELYVFVLANTEQDMYVGVAEDLEQELWRLRRLTSGRIAKHGLHGLVFFEIADSWFAAIRRRKQLSKLSRKQRAQLIEQANPQWRDLSPDPVVHGVYGELLLPYYRPFDEPDEGGGVAARLKPTPPTLSPGYGQPWPAECGPLDDLCYSADDGLSLLRS